MASHRTLFSQPDERRALEQLERLHREIQNARRQRERAGAEFDGFLASFQDPGTDTGAPGPVPSRRPRPARVPRPAALPPSSPETPASRDQTAVHPPAPPAPWQPRDRSPAPHPPRQEPSLDASSETALDVPLTRSRRRAALVATAIAILAVVIATFIWRSSTPASPDTQAPARTQPPPVVLPHEEIDSASPTPPAASPPILQVEITAVRSVWLRATVDGHRAVQRQVPAGTRLTFTPSDSITVRAGDAGAVRVKIGGGPEEPLGRDGQVLTRSFVVSR